MTVPTASGILTVMQEEILLPDGWEGSGIWRDSAENLAQFIADHRDHIALDDAIMLTGIGGILSVMDRRLREFTAH